MKIKKYNNKYLGLLILMALLSFTSIASAREDKPRDDSNLIREKQIDKTNSGSRAKPEIESVKENYRKEVEVLKDKYEKEIEVLKSKLGSEKGGVEAKAKELKYNNRISSLKVWTNAINRIKNLKERLNKAIEKANANGVNTDIAKASLTAADDKIIAIQAKSDAMKAILIKPLPMSEADKTSLQTLSKEAQTLTREANALLHKVLKELKEAIIAKKKATNTNSSSN